MADERKPDIMGSDDDALDEKVRKMMDPAAEDPPKPKKIEVSSGEAATAPEITDLPTPKEPLKIKILKDGPDEEIEPAAPIKPVTKSASKKIKVTTHADDMPVAAAAQVASEEPSETVGEEPATPGVDEASTIPEQDNSKPNEESAEAESVSESETEEAAAEVGGDEATDAAEPAEIPPGPAFGDQKTVEAVDDIMAREGDELLAADDEKIAAAFQPAKKQASSGRFKHFIGAWWRNPKARWLTFTALFIGLLVVAIVPTSRYFLLNTANVRSSMSLQALDNSTQQPLKNVRVSINGVSGLTGTDGRVSLAKVKLGPADVLIEKRAFAPLHQSVTVGWGSNPLGEFKLTPTGTQYDITVADYLSGKGVEGAEANSGEASALSDKDGKIKLTIDQPPDTLEVAIKGNGYRDENLKFSADNKAAQTAKLVPSRKEIFISKRSGKYDVYKIDIDGHNEQKILPGTGNERDDIALTVHPSDEVVAIVSTRDNKRNQDGFLLSTLTLINLSDDSTSSVIQSEQIKILDWIGDRLVYVQIAQGVSAANPKRQRLMSYNYKTNENKEVAASNYFNDVSVVGTKIYFAPSSASPGDNNSGLFKMDADGNNKQTILTQEVWNFFRVSYDHLAISANSATRDWYDYKLSDKVPVKLPGQPSNIASHTYADGPDSKKSLWVDNRDGKGVLLAYEPSTGNEQTLRTQSGLKNPVRWLNDNTVIYRINTEQETADYALSLNGGEPKKIRDVTNTSATDNWYYY